MTLEMQGDDRAYLRGKRPPSRGSRGTVRLVDLFSGCGGLTLGVVEAARLRGFATEVRLAVESDYEIAATYARNFDLNPEAVCSTVGAWFDRAVGRELSVRERRARLVVGKDLDFLVGGPPCQGHSTLNNYTRGVDPKNALYLTMVRAAEVLEPRAVVVENVPAVERDSRDVVQRAASGLERLGYKVAMGIVCVADIGVPQLRKRHLLVAHAESEPSVFDIVARARSKRRRALSWAIGDLRVRPGSPLDSPAAMTEENLRRAHYLLRHDLYDLPNHLRPRCQRGHHKYKSMYGRMRWDEPAQTITTGFGSPGQGRYFHPSEPRTLTPHEAARVQFIPDWFDFGPLVGHRKALARAIGNAVPPKLSFAIAHHLLELDDCCTAGRSSVALRRVAY